MTHVELACEVGHVVAAHFVFTHILVPRDNLHVDIVTLLGLSMGIFKDGNEFGFRVSSTLLLKDNLGVFSAVARAGSRRRPELERKRPPLTEGYSRTGDGSHAYSVSYYR